MKKLEAGSVVRVLAPGELLFGQGDRASAIYKVESGRLRLIRRTVDDHLVILQTARRGDLFAEASLFAEAYHCDAVAAAPSRVRVYPKAIVVEALRTDPALAQEFTARLARQLQDLRVQMELRNIRSARDRVLQYLRLRSGVPRSQHPDRGPASRHRRGNGRDPRGALSDAGGARSRRVSDPDADRDRAQEI